MELPHEGWYNGNVELMVLNGTYPKFREALIDMYKGNVKWSTMTQEKMYELVSNNDALWSAKVAVETEKAVKAPKPSEPKVATRQYRRRKSK